MSVFNNNVSVCYYLIVDMSRLATLSPYNINRERDKFLLGLFHFICDTSKGSEIVMMRYGALEILAIHSNNRVFFFPGFHTKFICQPQNIYFGEEWCACVCVAIFT